MHVGCNTSNEAAILKWSQPYLSKITLFDNVVDGVFCSLTMCYQKWQCFMPTNFSLLFEKEVHTELMEKLSMQ